MTTGLRKRTLRCHGGTKAWRVLRAGMLVAALLPGARAGAQTAAGLRDDARVDLPVSVGAAALLVGSEVLKGWLAPRACRLCDRNADGTEALNGLDTAVRAGLRWNDPDAANTASNLTGFAIAPVTSLGLCEGAAAADNRSREGPANALVVLEAAALAADLDQAVKFLVGRKRPFAHFRDPNDTRPHDPDENLSFYSGHTSLDFSLAVASGTVASMRGYRLAPAVWASSLPVALLTGYLRIAADKHYFTDVLAGAVLGSAVGFLVPFVFHRASPAPVDRASPAPVSGGGPFVAESWTF